MVIGREKGRDQVRARLGVNPCISDFTDKKGAFTENNEVYYFTGLIL
jgi:hypothetical protein